MRIAYAPACIYAGLSGCAAFYAFYKGAYDPSHSEFAGLPILILAMPWSWLFRGFNPRVLADSYNNNIVVESLFALVNVILLMLLGRIIQARSIRRTDASGAA